MLAELWSDLRYRLRAIVHRDAMERAKLTFGGIDRVKEESCDARGTILIESALQDLRYAVRGLRTKPGFTLGVVLTLGLRLVVGGVLLGLMVSFWAARWVAPLLFQESPQDPLVYGVVAAILMGVALAATAVPAIAASRVDPNVALRAD